MKCVHTFGTGRHKRHADITLLFEYIWYNDFLWRVDYNEHFKSPI